MITSKKFGIEIEFVGANPRLVEAAINRAGVDCFVENWNHTTRYYWKIVTDSSLTRVRGYAAELVSPILQGEAGVRELETVMVALNSVEGVTVNRSCGMHVHLDCNDMTMQQIRTVYERYADYEAQIDLCMPRSRRDSPRWCASIKDRKEVFKMSRNKSEGSRRQGRFFKVNLENIATRGSMEFRQHSGTTEFVKVANWLGFLMGFVEKSIELSNSVQKPKNSRWFNVVRNAFENVGYNFVWSRRLKAWEISNDIRVIGTVTNEQIKAVYITERKAALCTARANHDDISRYELLNLAETLGVRIYARIDNHINYSNATAGCANDSGWLDGVAQQVIDYMTDRQDELN